MFKQPSICIPRVFANMSEDRIRRAIDDKSVAKIAKVDIIAKVNEKGEKYNRVFVHFDHWFNTDYARQFRDDLLAGKEMTIMYDNPWFWKVSASKWKAEPNYQSSNTNVVLGTTTASTNFSSKLFNASTVDNRPYRERRIDPIYVAQDVAQGFLERKPRPAHIFIAPNVERGVVEKEPRKRRDKRSKEENDRRRHQDDLAYQTFLDIQQKRYDLYQEEKRYQKELEHQEEVNRRYQEDIKRRDAEEKEWVESIARIKIEEEKKYKEAQEVREWFAQAARLKEKSEKVLEKTRAAIKEEEDRLWAEKCEQLRIAKEEEQERQEKKVKKESRELMSMRLQKEFDERYQAELVIHARKKEETRQHILWVKSNPESRFNHTLPNAQAVRDYNEDFSEEFRGVIDPEDAYTISFGDVPLPDPLTLRRPRRRIIVE